LDFGARLGISNQNLTLFVTNWQR